MLKHAFEHLLVIQPDDDNPLALSRALVLAAQHQSQLTVFKCCHQNVQQQYKKGRADSSVQSWLQQQQSQLALHISELALTHAAIAPLAASQINVMLSYQEATRPALEQLLSQRNISLVIKQQQEKRTAFTWRMAPLDHYLISDTDIPVWLVKAATANQEMTILACLDVDDNHQTSHLLNEAILDLAEQLIPPQTQQLHVIHCFSEDDYSMSLPYDPKTGFEPRVDQQSIHRQKLASYVDKHALVPAQIHLSEGLPDDEIPKAVHWCHSQLAIIGNHHGHELGSALFGDTAHYLTEHLPCDVLVVKPPRATALPN